MSYVMHTEHMKIIVLYRYDRWEVIRKYGYRESLIAVRGTRQEAVACADEYRRAESETSAYDYDNQAWTINGRYVRCGHPESMDCGCYGRLHAGEKASL